MASEESSEMDDKGGASFTFAPFLPSLSKKRKEAIYI